MKNFIALLIFCSGFGGWYLYREYTRVQTDLKEARQNLAAYQTALATKRAEFKSIVGALDLQKKVLERQAEIKVIRDKTNTLTDEEVALRRQKSQLISRIRQKEIDRVVPELNLSDGRKLESVRILKIDDGGVTLSAAGGVIRVLSKDLPSEWRQRLHYP